MSNAKAIKSYQGFDEGSYAARKGRLCQIKKIHFEMHPPSVTVLMMDNNTEVGTEFDRLQHIKSWFCDICTAENSDNSTTKCSFCKMNRSFKERITIQDENEQNNDEQQKQENKQTEKAEAQDQSSDDAKQTESAELTPSESDETEPDRSEEPDSEPEEEVNDEDEYETIPDPQDKEPDQESEEDAESEEEYYEPRYQHPQNRRRYGHNPYYYDDDDEYTKYRRQHSINNHDIYGNRNAHRNRNINRNRTRRNRNPFGFDGWNAFPSFDSLFL